MFRQFGDATAAKFVTNIAGPSGGVGVWTQISQIAIP